MRVQRRRNESESSYAFVINTSIPGARVVRTLEQLVEWRGKADAIRVDNGPEYLS